MLLQLETEKVKYSTSSLSGFDLNNYALQLEKLMTEKKLFRDNEINLTKLSKELGISSHILSQVLNQHYNINFYEYINQFRIDEVKKQLLIKENQNLTIISIAFDAGFNSKSSFQKIFKKYVGKTPSTYMKENLK